MTPPKLARLVGNDRTWVWRVLTGTGNSSPELAIRIEEATSGAIKRGDLRPDLWPTAKEPAA